MGKEKIILFGVLNWGLGHAARSIPIIQELLREGYKIIIASDGNALRFLQKEFPLLNFEKLPAYNIEYSKKSFLSSLKLSAQFPHILKTFFAEKQTARQLVQKYNPDIIISDNRFGFRVSGVKNIYITHQLRVLSGFTTALTSFIHHLIYRKFDQIWVPDNRKFPYLSGKLGHINLRNDKIKYTGILSRFHKETLSKKYDMLAVLSGPEPQRSLLEEKLLQQFAELPFKSALVQGKVEGEARKQSINGIDIYNYLNTRDLQDLLNRSEIVIARSGYTSVMDLIHLQKKILWIPTPGQYEQEYLARFLAEKFGFLYQKQNYIQLDKNLFDKLTAVEIIKDCFGMQKPNLPVM